MQQIAIIQISEAGKDIANTLQRELGAKIISRMEVGQRWNDFDAFVIIGAMGICVRTIAPYVKDKHEDPAVVCVDSTGLNVISVLSGHVGGANDLARRLSDITGATPVITTATDVNDSFSIDEFARDNHLTIRNKDKIKSVSGKVLRGEPIRISIEDFPPQGDCDVVISDEEIAGEGLWLSPKRYVLGIGCKKGKSCEEIEALVSKALEQCGIDYSDIGAFGSIDLKAKEEGFIELSRRHRIPFVTFSSEMLLKAKGEFTASEFVKETTGVDNVCERAAVLLTGNRGKLVLGKQAAEGVTVAVARR